MSDRAEFLEAVQTSAWDEGRECPHCKGEGRLYPGRRIIHCILGGIGADWDEADVLDLIQKADAVKWHRGLLGTVIAAHYEDKWYAFDQLAEQYRDRAEAVKP
jgi:hypothetical protein